MPDYTDCERTRGKAMYQRILLPVDGSEHALRAVDTVIEPARRLRAKVYGMHVLHLCRLFPG